MNLPDMFSEVRISCKIFVASWAGKRLVFVVVALLFLALMNFPDMISEVIVSCKLFVASGADKRFVFFADGY